MTTYTYLAADLRTNAILGELPLDVRSFSRVLNGVGDLSGTMPLTDPKVKLTDPITATTPKRTALYVDRDGTLVWGGVVWTRDWRQGKLALTAKTFGSYFDRRRIRETQIHAAADQLDIARYLIDSAQAKHGGDIGILTDPSVSSGRLRDRTYNGFEAKPVLEALEQLSAVIDGFDFAFDVRYDSNGDPEKLLTLDYPRRGRTFADSSDLVFELPGNVLDYAWPEDGTESADTIIAQGGGEEEAMLVSTVSDVQQIDAGFPLLEDVVAYKDVSDQATLDSHAQAELVRVAGNVTIPEVKVRADAHPTLGSYIEGDEVRLRITDDRFPEPSTGGYGLDVVQRIVGMTVTPAQRSQPEYVTLTLNPA